MPKAISGLTNNFRTQKTKDGKLQIEFEATGKDRITIRPSKDLYVGISTPLPHSVISSTWNYGRYQIKTEALGSGKQKYTITVINPTKQNELLAVAINDNWQETEQTQKAQAESKTENSQLESVLKTLIDSGKIKLADIFKLEKETPTPHTFPTREPSIEDPKEIIDAPGSEKVPFSLDALSMFYDAGDKEKPLYKTFKELEESEVAGVKKPVHIFKADKSGKPWVFEISEKIVLDDMRNPHVKDEKPYFFQKIYYTKADGKKTVGYAFQLKVAGTGNTPKEKEGKISLIIIEEGAPFGIFQTDKTGKKKFIFMQGHAAEGVTVPPKKEVGKTDPAPGAKPVRPGYVSIYEYWNRFITTKQQFYLNEDFTVDTPTRQLTIDQIGGKEPETLKDDERKVFENWVKIDGRIKNYNEVIRSIDAKNRTKLVPDGFHMPKGVTLSDAMTKKVSDLNKRLLTAMTNLSKVTYNDEPGLKKAQEEVAKILSSVPSDVISALSVKDITKEDIITTEEGKDLNWDNTMKQDGRTFPYTVLPPRTTSVEGFPIGFRKNAGQTIDLKSLKYVLFADPTNKKTVIGYYFQVHEKEGVPPNGIVVPASESLAIIDEEKNKAYFINSEKLQIKLLPPDLESIPAEPPKS